MAFAVEGFDKMIAGSLMLEEPWYVSDIKVDGESKSMHIYVSVREDARFVCPKCGGETKRYGYEKKERVWRHSNVFFIYPCYVHCRRPKVHCPHCGAQQISAPFERKNSRHTLLFEGMVMLHAGDCPLSVTADMLGCNEKTVTSIVRYWTRKALAEVSLENMCKLAVDETSFRKGHDYVTLFIDAEKRAVVDVEQGRDGGTVDRFTTVLAEKGGASDNIVSVTSDMSRSFIPAIDRNFPNAEHTIDKFHVKQIVINALDEVRKQEQKAVNNKRQLFLGRRLFMIPKKKLTQEQKTAIIQMSRLYPKTGRAYRIVAAFDEFYYSKSTAEAEEKLNQLYSWMRRCRLEPMKEAAETLNRHKVRILNYFTDRLTNAICEGINSMVQAAKRKARGYHTFDGFSTMIYLVAGKLEIESPFPMLA